MNEKLASRRNVLYGAAAAGVAVPVLAACGSSDDSGDTAGSAPTASDPTTSAAPSSPATSAGTSAAPEGSIPTSEIPVGGGKIFAADKIVVTQPEAGDFKAFTAVCTHQGCVVASISSGKIQCPCHGSQYSISDGSVQGGPAPAPLSEKKVTVTGDSLVVS